MNQIVVSQMSPLPSLVRDPLNRFQELYSALYADRVWFGDASSLNFAAMTAVTCPGTPSEHAATQHTAGQAAGFV